MPEVNPQAPWSHLRVLLAAFCDLSISVRYALVAANLDPLSLAFPHILLVLRHLQGQPPSSAVV
jgi:hypothetical protein